MITYEVIYSIVGDKYELKKVGLNVVTKATKELLRLWPKNWTLICDFSSLLELVEVENTTL